MITTIQINKAINEMLESSLIDTEFSDVPFKPEDTTEIVRPSIKVRIEDNKTGKFNSCNKERTLTCRVYFFAKDRYKYKIDNSKMQDIIENAFLEDVKVTDTFLMPVTEDGVDSNIVDTVLICSFDLYSIEEIVDPTEYEPMEELNLNLEYEGE